MKESKTRLTVYILTAIIVAIMLFAFLCLGQYLSMRFGSREVYSFGEAAGSAIGISVGLVLYQSYINRKNSQKS